MTSISTTSSSQIVFSFPDSIVAAWRPRLISWWNNTFIVSLWASYSELPQQPDRFPDAQLIDEDLDSAMEALRLSKARRRTYWLAIVLCCGGALFGYDSGVIGKPCLI